MLNIGKYRIADLIKGIILTTIIVAILGYIDYITGDISIDIFYMFCVVFVTWFTNGAVGALCILEIIFAKTTADYLDSVNIVTFIYDWNILYSIIVNIMVCLLIVKLKKALSK